MDSDTTYRVIRLAVENYKRLKAADVTPGRNAVIVSGRNKAGKTSLLDSIAAVLGGKKQVAAKPIHTGAESSQIICILGDKRPELLVKRVFSADGKTAVEITSAEGYRAPSPQAILDSLCGAIAFDPLSFTRMDDKAQLETLRQIVGLDFTDIDKQRKQLYDNRAIANRDAKNYAAQAAGVRVPEGTPDEEVSVGDLMMEQKRRQDHNQRNQSERNRIAMLVRDSRMAEINVSNAEAKVSDLEAKLLRAKSELSDTKAAMEQAVALQTAQEATCNVLEDQNVDEIQRHIIDAQAINANVANAKRRAELQALALAAAALSNQQTAEIDALDASKESQLAAVKWPIENLSFSEDGVIYNGLPFSQASGAEQLSVSFAMSAALNPKLKIAIVRDASLLDEEQMAAVCKLAEQYDTQVWLEVVDDTAGPNGILIEDGEIVSGGTPVDSAPVEKPKRAKKQPASETATPPAPLDGQQSLPFDDEE